MTFSIAIPAIATILFNDVADTHHFDTDPDPDLIFTLMRIRILTFNLMRIRTLTFNLMRIQIQDPTTHFFPDLDPPMLQNDPLRLPPYTLMQIRILLFTLMQMRIRILLFTFDADVDPDPAFHFDADVDPDPAFHFDADVDPDPAFHFDADLDPASQNVRIYADPDPQHCLCCSNMIRSKQSPLWV